MPLTGDRKREYQREWVARRRAEWFSDKSCVECDDTEGLELDHIDPSLKISHNIWSWSKVKRDVELEKCQVLCHACHKIKSLIQFPLTNGQELTKHGEYQHYKRGCRCVLCTASVAPYWREYRQKKNLLE